MRQKAKLEKSYIFIYLFLWNMIPTKKMNEVKSHIESYLNPKLSA